MKYPHQKQTGLKNGVLATARPGWSGSEWCWKFSLLIWLGLFLSCSAAKTERLDFLTGTWKVSGKEQYEVWEKNGKRGFRGYAYRGTGAEQQITERLEIRLRNGRLVYEATVPDQNEGATIRFSLNEALTDRFSFENAQHDFPKKIQYRLLTADRIEVTVLGEAGKGFSYIQERE
ncbi:DUF6265 family protein [Flavilitoribacter nigricans]|nr:DUF6265 family protein [Flavilitoribacter nigricans]